MESRITSAQDTYELRTNHWKAAMAQAEKTSRVVGNWRLLTAVVAIALVWLAVGKQVITLWWVVLPIAFFIGLVARHQAVLRQQTLARRAVAFYGRAVDRLQNRWPGKGISGDEFRDPNHLYADDLDLFGTGSLFEFVCQARTRAGEQLLASWFLSASTAASILERQEAVRDLSPRFKLREQIALLGEDIRANVRQESIARWVQAEHNPVRPLRIVGFLLSCFGLLSLFGFFAGLVPAVVVAAALALNFSFSFWVRERVRSIIDSIETPADDLGLFSVLLKKLEEESFSSALTRRLQSSLATEGNPASARIGHLQRWLQLLESRDHLLLRALQPLILWREQTALGAEQWRLQNRLHIPKWLQAVAEYEALSSLALLSFEHPDWCFPAVHEESRSVFNAQQLRHPLLPSTKSIANDLGYPQPLQLWIISGSNMSGKSTLLRAVGLNAVLALAGSPVAASQLSLSRLRVGASIRVNDSLLDNRSRFMAEITRLREIVHLSQTGEQVLFLLDELLSGTNSHDRRIGASSIASGLVEAGAIGLITTHDLALTDIANDLSPLAANAHFQDELAGGTIEFDYQLRPGIVTRSNALELMRAVGLKV
jgi:hypothetical protein